MKTQKERLLYLLQNRGDKGVYVYELIAPRPEGAGIAQYNARVKELREDGYDIENTKPGHFVLHDKQQKLNKLREEWKQAKAKGRYGEMKLIEARANVLKMKEDTLIADVREALVGATNN